ncbi:hypothetical protein [Cupriavidus sp. IK-TO18]|uniref:hypothetical protein n=1 Tax=Cupriavidus sp. IK-TO18 TaxID=2782182 RepID=UPI00189C4455|nr:hypothetical protein [Cupriavidus sp. IK-TO18]MBF6986753.1 hypothetical protein [Cupriavidus sp. IK-TO18]
MITKDEKYPNLDPRKFFNDSLDDHIQPSEDEMNELVYRMGNTLPAGDDYDEFVVWLKMNHPGEDPDKWLRN